MFTAFSCTILTLRKGDIFQATNVLHTKKSCVLIFAPFNSNRDSWISSLKIAFLLEVSPIFLWTIKIQYTHSWHVRYTKREPNIKKYIPNWSQLSFKTANIDLRRKKTLLGGFFGFYFTIYRCCKLYECVAVCVCVLHCTMYIVAVELMHDLTVNIVQTVCCLCSVQFLLTECIDAYLPARLCSES